MATWQDSLTLTAPAGLTGLVDGLNTLVTAANATLDAAETAMDAASVLLSGTASPQAAAAAALVTQAENIIGDLFGSGFFRLFAHPWQHGVGRGSGIFRSLSFPNCVQAIAESLEDQGDAARPQFSSLTACEMIVLVAGTPSPAIFRQVLDALNALLDAKEFRLAKRRLDQAFELEADRYNITVGSRLPDWESVTVREMLPALNPLEDALVDSLAMLKGYADGSNKAVDIAADLIAAKRAQLTTLQNRLNAAAALFGQGLSNAGVYPIHITGAPGSSGLKAELISAGGAPGPELSFCAGVAFVGLDGTLGATADVLNLA